MTREEFKELNILDQIEFFNSRTITGLTVGEVAQETNMSESAIRRIFKKNNYVFDRIKKIYSSTENNKKIAKEVKINQPAITQETLKNNNKKIAKEIKINLPTITKETLGITKEVKSNNSYLTKDELKDLKELLEVKDQLLNMAITTGNNTGITIIDISNIDRSNRKKATFNMSIDILNKLETYNNNPNISKSDIVNIAINEYLKNK